MSIDDFRGTSPLFLPEVFFIGRLEGWAVMGNLIGGLTRRATIKAVGSLEEETATVLFTETYTFDDDHSDTLHWTIRKLSEGRYSGHENHLEGEATGEQAALSTGGTRAMSRKPTAN